MGCCSHLRNNRITHFIICCGFLELGISNWIFYVNSANVQGISFISPIYELPFKNILLKKDVLNKSKINTHTERCGSWVSESSLSKTLQLTSGGDQESCSLQHGTLRLWIWIFCFLACKFRPPSHSHHQSDATDCTSAHTQRWKSVIRS